MTRSGTAVAPIAARGWGIDEGTPTTGVPCWLANRTSSPPPATTTTDAPAAHAASVLDSVSSVFPEQETAKTSERGPTQAGSW
jgi:hypothetical protein